MQYDTHLGVFPACMRVKVILRVSCNSIDTQTQRVTSKLCFLASSSVRASIEREGWGGKERNGVRPEGTEWPEAGRNLFSHGEIQERVKSPEAETSVFRASLRDGRLFLADVMISSFLSGTVPV
jgi:hypothetical protein